MPQFETIGNVCATVTVFTVRMMDSPPEELPTYTIFTPDAVLSENFTQLKTLRNAAFFLILPNIMK